MGSEQQWASAANTVVALVASYGLRVLGAIAILVIGWTISRFVYRAIANLCARSARFDRTVTVFLANGARYAILVFTFVAVLTSFGIATTSFVAVLGALGIAVGLALQGTLSNLAAGIMLIVFRPFHVGDRIETGGVVGVTREINLFFSELDTDDNVRVVVPNGMLWGAVVKVLSRNNSERIELKFTRPLADDLEDAIALIKDVVERDRRVMRTAELGVLSVNQDNYVLVARLWVTRDEAMQVAFDLNRSVKDAFQHRAELDQVAATHASSG
jgi:small conductance mechanosensitive channel